MDAATDPSIQDEGRFEVVDIEVNRTEGLHLVFADGYEADFELLLLRLGCPCAECRGRREVGRAAWVPRTPDETPTIIDAKLHGAYAMGITWHDGHATGIYSWEYLRRWAESGDVATPPIP